MKRVLTMILLAALCVSLCGCDLWMDGTYHSVRPHQDSSSQQSDSAAEVSDYNQLRKALENMVSDGRQEGVLYVTGLDAAQLNTYMNIAAGSITGEDPIGAYAVEEITYQVGNNVGRTAVAVTIRYHHSRAEILRIKRTENMDQVQRLVLQALGDCDTGAVVLVENYEQTDFVQMVQSFAEDNPDVCMEMPQVSASIYPNNGRRRLIELSFAYQNNRDTLYQMQDYVQPIFRAANLNVSAEEGETTKFSRMYAFLMERNEYQIETSITPAYSLLRHGVGDSKAFAVVYAAMCREAGLECRIVTGTRDGEPWVWNLICADEVYYFVDLLRSKAAGSLQRLTQEDMRGYVWDYSAYPETGPEYYAQQETEPQQPDQPEEPEAPQEPQEPTEPAQPAETEPAEPTEPTQPETEPEETEPEPEPEL